MKIDGHKSDRVDQPDEKKPNEQPSKAEEKGTFKKLLKRKERGENSDDGKRSLNPQGKKSSGSFRTGRKETPARGKMPKEQLGPLGKDGEFGERIKGGKLQLSRQAERSERHGIELTSERHQHETRLEEHHRKKHHRQVGREHSQKGDVQGRREEPGRLRQKALKQGAGVNRRAMNQGDNTAERLEQAPQSREIEGAKAFGAADAKAANAADQSRSAERAEKRAQVAELARKLVDKAHVGKDAAGRQIMLVDLEVPGRGNVRVRLRRRGDGFELRMRAENEALARDLRHDREHFRKTAAEKGVDFTSIEIV